MYRINDDAGKVPRSGIKDYFLAYKLCIHPDSQHNIKREHSLTVSAQKVNRKNTNKPT